MNNKIIIESFNSFTNDILRHIEQNIVLHLFSDDFKENSNNVSYKK